MSTRLNRHRPAPVLQAEIDGGPTDSTGINPPEDKPADVPARPAKDFALWEVVQEDQRDEYRRLVAGLVGERRVEVVYNLPSAGQIMYLARTGGTGLLEDYSGGPVRSRIHDRNLAVARNIKGAYSIYIASYIDKVHAVDSDVNKAKKEGLPHPEVVLHDLGAPDSNFTYPKPAGASSREYRDILEAGHTKGMFQAYRAVSDKLDDIWNKRSEGSMFFVVEFSAEAGNYFGPLKGAKVSWNFDVDERGRFNVGNVKHSVPLTIGKMPVKGPGGATLSVEYDKSTGEFKTKANLKVGKYGFSADSTGTVTATYGPAFAESNHVTAIVGAGVDISLRDLVAGYFTPLGQPVPEWVADLPNLKLKIGVFYRGLTQGTAMKVVVRNSPGFFESRTRTQLIAMDWESLDKDERDPLDALGWDKDSWDFKRRPQSAKRRFFDMSSEEKFWSMYLPLPRSDPEWQIFWQGDFMNARRIVQEGGSE